MEHKNCMYCHKLCPKIWFKKHFPPTNYPSVVTEWFDQCGKMSPGGFYKWESKV